MKRRLSFLFTLALVCALLCGTPTRAAAADAEPFDDGGRIETEVRSGSFVPELSAGAVDEEHSESAETRTVQKTLVRRYYDADGNLDWLVALTATFRYTGVSARCTEAYARSRVYDNAWRLTASNVTKSGNHAAATFTLSCAVTGVPVKTVDTALDLYCDRSGTVSTEPLSAGLTLSFLQRWLAAVQALLRRLFGR